MTWPANTIPASTLSLDASALINLLATTECERILEALDRRCIVEEHVLEEITRHPIPEYCHLTVIETLSMQGLISIERMSDASYDLYLNLVSGDSTTALDDGESATIAIGIERAASPILDDGKARKLFAKQFVGHSYYSSLHLLLSAARNAKWPKERVVNCASLARRHARIAVVRGEEEWARWLGIR